MAWIGVVTIGLVCSSIIYSVFVFTLYYTVHKRNVLKYVAKLMYNFYVTLPDAKEDSPYYPYVLCVFDRQTGKIIKYQEVTSDFKDEKQVEEQFQKLKESLTREKQIGGIQHGE